jgi:two-component system CheB/CheR fusion protein
VTLKGVPYSGKEGVLQYLDIEITPLFADSGLPLGVSLAFLDASPAHQLTLEIERARQEQETANEELQSSNEELQTTNEELQSTVEELQTTNEELQSTNEEMETMNEELRSTNEELRGANDQLRNRTEELGQANSFTQSLLTNVSVALIVVDPELQIVLWNAAAKNMWGLDADDVRGKSVLDLEIGLPVDKLADVLRTAVAGGAVPQKVILDAVDRRGKPFRCRVTITPSAGTSPMPFGAVLVMEVD